MLWKTTNIKNNDQFPSYIFETVSVKIRNLNMNDLLRITKWFQAHWSIEITSFMVEVNRRDSHVLQHRTNRLTLYTEYRVWHMSYWSGQQTLMMFVKIYNAFLSQIKHRYTICFSTTEITGFSVLFPLSDKRGYVETMFYGNKSQLYRAGKMSGESAGERPLCAILIDGSIRYALNIFLNLETPNLHDIAIVMCYCVFLSYPLKTVEDWQKEFWR